MNIETESQKYIDVRSDTVTHPTQAMKEAMLYSRVGDDVFKQDSTVLELEALTAEITDKEDALFMFTGVMSNQISILTHLKGQKGIFFFLINILKVLR